MDAAVDTRQPRADDEYVEMFGGGQNALVLAEAGGRVHLGKLCVRAPTEALHDERSAPGFVRDVLGSNETGSPARQRGKNTPQTFGFCSPLTRRCSVFERR
jgi:hypothetical protein